jgi:Ribbon-helix-helix protein, copG family
MARSPEFPQPEKFIQFERRIVAKIGRPRKDEGDVQQSHTIRMPGSTWARVDQAAQEDEVSRSEVVRRAVAEHLDRRDAERA